MTCGAFRKYVRSIKPLEVRKWFHISFAAIQLNRKYENFFAEIRKDENPKMTAGTLSVVEKLSGIVVVEKR